MIHKNISKFLFNRAIRKSKPFKTLSKIYGRHQNERCIEIEFVRHYYSGENTILDIGCDHAEPNWFNMISSIYIPKIIGLDISQKNIPSNYHRVVKGDIRQTIFKNNFFDAIFCISTLEHVGMDNKIYNQPTEANANSQLQAMKEMYRILKPRGKLFLTVPFGKYFNYNWFIQYDLQSLAHIVIQSNFITKKLQTYSYKHFWKFCKVTHCKNIKYLNNKHQARAVVCLLLSK